MSWTPQCIEKWFLWCFSNFEPQAIPTFHWIKSAPKSDSKSPAFWMVKAMHGASNRVTLQRITDPSRWQRVQEFFLVKFFHGHFCESWHDWPCQTWRRAGPLSSRVFNLFEEGDPPEREVLGFKNWSQLEQNGKKAEVLSVKILTQSQELRKIGRSFPEGPQIFLLICCAYILLFRSSSSIRDINCWCLQKPTSKSRQNKKNTKK